MKKIALIISLSLFSLLAYQNCGQKISSGQSSSQSVSSVYPYYSEKNEFFDSVQLIKADVQADNSIDLSFAATIAYADDPEAILDVEYRVQDENGDLVCPRIIAQVNNSNNHIEIDDCLAVKQLKSVTVVVQAKLKTESQSHLRTVSSSKFSL
jgi:hypothetical protein